MRGKWINLNTLFLMPIAGIIILAGITLHDVATAQGIGLYFSILAGNVDRIGYDLAVDIIGMIALLLVLILPGILLKHRGIDSLLRFAAVYFSFMPAISLGYLAHLFDGHSLWMFEFDWQINLNHLVSFLQIVIPAMFILGFFYIQHGMVIKKWHKCLLYSCILLGACALFMPELSDVAFQIIYYFLAIIAFDWWEILYSKAVLFEKVILWLIFVVFYCRGCLQMLELMSAFHL